MLGQTRWAVIPFVRQFATLRGQILSRQKVDDWNTILLSNDVSKQAKGPVLYDLINSISKVQGRPGEEYLLGEVVDLFYKYYTSLEKEEKVDLFRSLVRFSSVNFDSVGRKFANGSKWQMIALHRLNAQNILKRYP